MSVPSMEFEFESSHEFEGELEFENEFEFEGTNEFEGEQEQFIGGLLKLAKRGLQSPALRKIGMNAAKTALGGLGSLLSEQEGEFEGEGEFESEFESAFEFETNPIRRIYPDMMMEHFAHVAAEAETEYEAGEALLPLAGLAASKLLPVAAKAAPRALGAIPRIAASVMKITPLLTKKIAEIGKMLHQNPKTRVLIRALPQILRTTVKILSQMAARGRPITPLLAAQVLAQVASKILGSPYRSIQAYKKSGQLDKQFHHHHRHRHHGHHHHGHHPHRPHHPGHEHHKPGYRVQKCQCYCRS